MAKREVTIGTGITAEQRTTYDGDDLRSGVETLMQTWTAAHVEGSGDFGAVALGMVRQSRWILDAAPPERAPRDSPVDFARRIMSLYEIARAEIGRGNADSASRFAFEAGYLFSQAVLKSQWEDHALKGKKLAERLAEGAASANAMRRGAAAAEHSVWQSAADEIWHIRPEWTNTQVARAIVRREAEHWRVRDEAIRHEYPGATEADIRGHLHREEKSRVNTIRRRIKRP